MQSDLNFDEHVQIYCSIKVLKVAPTVVHCPNFYLLQFLMIVEPRVVQEGYRQGVPGKMGVELLERWCGFYER